MQGAQTIEKGSLRVFLTRQWKQQDARYPME